MTRHQSPKRRALSLALTVVLLFALGYFMRRLESDPLGIDSRTPMRLVFPEQWREHVVLALVVVPLHGPSAAEGRAFLRGVLDGTREANAAWPAHGPHLLVRIVDGSARTVDGRPWRAFFKDKDFDVVLVSHPPTASWVELLQDLSGPTWLGCLDEPRPTSFRTCDLLGLGEHGGRAVVDLLAEAVRLGRVGILPLGDVIAEAAPVLSAGGQVLVDASRNVTFEPGPDWRERLATGAP